MSDTQAIYEVMNAVKRDVGHIGKNDRNTHFNFNFRGIDSVMNAFHQPMVDHGLVVLPSYGRPEYEQAGDAVRCRIPLTLTFYAPDGSSLEAHGAGEAIDKQDKATPQAMQQAFKYTLLQAFSVPTQDMEDSDASGPVASAPSSGPVCDGCGESLAGAAGVKVRDGQKFHADCEPAAA